MLGTPELGLVIIAWAAGAFVFRDWLARLDLAVRRALDPRLDHEEYLEAQRRNVRRVALTGLGVGLLIFASGIALHLVG
ncbi:MAG: hypothetical protein QOE92_801 [Chloroflexota bacterium]|jgi:hypothetical protein|nr:hypothetical protein [Chloroflexota bacterium]